MKLEDTYAKIEHFILESLNHRYNSQVPQKTFVIAQSVTDTITSRSKKLILKSTTVQQFQKVVFRFPQSRIYYSLFQNVELQVGIIEYFNWHILFLEGDCASVNLKHSSTLSLYEINAQGLVNSAPSFLPKSRGVYLIAPAKKVAQQKSIIYLLNEIRKIEYQIHPINAIFTEDVEVLTQIDEDFANIPFIHEKGKLKIDFTRFRYAIFLLELFLQTGQFELLLQALKRKVVVQKALNGQIHNHLSDFLVRLRWALQLQGQDFPPKLFALIEQPSSEESFCTWYFRGQTLSPEQKEHVQNIWESLAVPALELYWNRKAKQEPEQFLAFLLLALENHFVWVEQAFKKIYHFISPEDRPLFRLLFNLHRIAFIQLNYKARFGTYYQWAFKQALQWSKLTVDYHRFGKQRFSVLKLPNQNLSIKINQLVQWEFDDQEKVLIIKPNLIVPPLKEPKFDYHLLQWANLKIKIPLLWQQFVVELNQTRFKWIRKKRRFQLSVKVPKQNTENIVFDGQIIKPQNVYQKYYLPIKPIEGQWYINFNDDRGIRFEKLHASCQKIILNGYAIDRFGILKSTFNFKSSESKRNHQIDGLNREWQPLPIGRLPLKFQLTSRHCSPFSGQLQKCDLFVQALLNIKAELIPAKLTFWLLNSQEMLKIKETFFNILGVYPKIIVTSPDKFHPLAETFNMVAGLIPKDDLVQLETDEIKLVQCKKDKNVRYLWVATDRLASVLKQLFFMQKIVKI